MSLRRALATPALWISSLCYGAASRINVCFARGRGLFNWRTVRLWWPNSRKLRHVLGFSENRIRSVLYELRNMSDQAESTENLHVVADDPDDDEFIECALGAGVSLIV